MTSFTVFVIFSEFHSLPGCELKQCLRLRLNLSELVSVHLRGVSNLNIILLNS